MFKRIVIIIPSSMVLAVKAALKCVVKSGSKQIKTGTITKTTYARMGNLVMVNRKERP